MAKLRYTEIAPVDAGERGVIIPGLDNGAVVYDAAAFGLSEDATGAANVTAIEAAIAEVPADKFGVIRIPWGAFPINDEIQIQRSNIAIEGVGKYGSLLVPDASMPDDGWSFDIGNGVSPLENIAIRNLGIYCENNPDGVVGITQHGVVSVNLVRGLEIRNFYSYNASGGLMLKSVSEFHVDGVSVRECRDFSVAFLGSATQDGVLSNLVCYEVGEVIDFGNNSDIVVVGVRAHHPYPGRGQEAIDMGASRRLHLSDMLIEGDWPNGVNCKDESTSGTIYPCEDITFDNVRLYGMLQRGFNLRSNQANGGTVVTGTNIRLINCEAVKGAAATTYQALEVVDGSQFDGLEIRGGRYVSNRTAINIKGLWSKRVLVDGPELQTDTADANGIALQIQNSKFPIVRNVRVPECGSSGIYMYWDSQDAIDATNDILNGTIENCRVRNHGGAVTGAVGIRVRANFGAGETGTYNVLRVCGNEVIIDESGTRGSKTAIGVEIGDLAAIDYAKIDGNLCYRVPTGISAAGLGANSTQNNNTVRTTA